LLPEKPARKLLSIRDEGGWYRAVVEVSSIEPETRDGRAAPTAAPEGAQTPGQPDAPQGTPASGEPQGTPEREARRDVLSRLYEVVREREKSMPEGSYTSYLFASGPEKIRKKTGEEAVELVLAREHGEIVAESADLIYHLLVLLRASDIEVGEVLEELRGRLET
jgi:phosphoribosyl-ATP pyrophosphohydrolase